jgi:uncharacterized protein YggL (DUF469 family)
MAWKQRSGRTYYYRSVRRGGQVVSEYVGTGLLGRYAAILDEQAQDERLMARIKLKRFVHEQARIDRLIDDYRRQVRDLTAGTLQALGFHQHKRQWRLRRGEVQTMANEEVKEYVDLMRAANKANGKGAAVKRLREYADAHPGAFDAVNMLARTTRTEVINYCTRSETTRIHLEGETRALERSLGITTATPLERLLIQDVVLCWLRLQAMEQTYSGNWASSEGVTFSKGLYLEKRLDATRRRYLQSVETLAKVRGLLVRAGVQINMAQQMLVQNN